MRHAVLGITLAGAFTIAHAATSVQGLTFTTVTDFDYPQCCYLEQGHAAIGSYANDERKQGFSEFNLAGMAAGAATVSFRYVSFAASSYSGTTYPATGTVTLSAYQGDNVASVLDYGQNALVGVVGSFDITAYQPGDLVTLDISSFYNAALAGGWAALGLRLSAVSPPLYNFNTYGFVTYDSFTLAAVPEPGTWAMTFGGLGLMCLVACRRKAGRSTGIA